MNLTCVNSAWCFYHDKAHSLKYKLKISNPLSVRPADVPSQRAVFPCVVQCVQAKQEVFLPSEKT